MGKKLSTKEAAKRLGKKNHQTLANWRSQGKGPVYHKMLGRVFYYESDLDRFENAQRIVPENNF